LNRRPFASLADPRLNPAVDFVFVPADCHWPDLNAAREQIITLETPDAGIGIPRAPPHLRLADDPSLRSLALALAFLFHRFPLQSAVSYRSEILGSEATNKKEGKFEYISELFFQMEKLLFFLKLFFLIADQAGVFRKPTFFASNNCELDASPNPLGNGYIEDRRALSYETNCGAVIAEPFVAAQFDVLFI
jgi:hypothetical protein